MDKSSKMKKIGLGFALLVLGIILVGGKGKNIKTSYTFADEPVTVSGFSINSDESTIPQKILIPDLSLDIDIQRSKIVNGYWEVFENTAGWGEGSGVPGEKGNQVVFAHAREGLFGSLNKVKSGMNIYILAEENMSENKNTKEKGDGTETSKKWFKYEVVEIKEVYPNQTEVIAPTDDETLTLYTCSGFGDSKRLIVVAKPV